MKSPSRRHLLLGGIGVLSLSSGCLDRFDDSDDPVRFCTASVLNRDNAPHKVYVRLLEKDTILYEDSATLAADEGEDVDQLLISSDGLESVTGYFSFYVRVNDDDWEELYLPDYATDQIGVVVFVSTDSTVDFLISADDHIPSC